MVDAGSVDRDEDVVETVDDETASSRLQTRTGSSRARMRWAELGGAMSGLLSDSGTGLRRVWSRLYISDWLSSPETRNNSIQIFFVTIIFPFFLVAFLLDFFFTSVSLLSSSFQSSSGLCLSNFNKITFFNTGPANRNNPRKRKWKKKIISIQSIAKRIQFKFLSSVTYFYKKRIKKFAAFMSSKIFSPN